MSITTDISADKIIMDNSKIKFIYYPKNGFYDVRTPNGSLLNVYSTINVFNNGVMKLKLSREEKKFLGSHSTKCLKKIFVFLPDPIKKEHFSDDMIIIEDFSDSVGKGKLAKISLNYSNLQINGVFSCTIIIKLYEPLVQYESQNSKIKQNNGFLTLQLQIDKWEKFDAPPEIHSIAPLFGDETTSWKITTNYYPSPNNITFFRNGYQSWSICETLDYFNKSRITPTKIGKINLQNQDVTIQARYFSEMVSAITDVSTSKSLILGFITNSEKFGQILMERMNKNSKFNLLMALSQFDNIPINLINEKPIRSEELFIKFSEPYQGQLCLKDWAGFTAIRMNSKIISLKTNPKNPLQPPIREDIKVLSGWCSWYYYYTKISETDMVKNIDFFEEHPEFPIDIIQLDDGYQTNVGDFTSINEKFPNGMKLLVDKIHDNNHIAGLWIAPFFAQDKSNLVKQHPEWFLKDKKGKFIKTSLNWGSYLYALDLTRDDVIEHIKNLVTTIIQEWGFDFIKIDFIFAPEAICAIYSDNSRTRAQILRRGVEVIRETMGDKILLGCAAPLGPCIGLVDVMRIGEDTAANWMILGSLGNFLYNKLNLALPSLKPALIATIMRSFMHNTLWFNDPDCVVVRKNNSKLSLNEVQLQLTIFGLSGGQVFFSDDLTLLSEDRLNYMSLVIPPYKEGAIALDLMENNPPCLFGMDTTPSIGRRILLSIINWDKNPKDVEIVLEEVLRRLGAQHMKSEEFIVFDYWSEKDLKILGRYKRTDKIHFYSTSGHFSKYLSIIPVDELDLGKPIFLSSNLHITQGCKEVSSYEFSSEQEKRKLIIEFSIEGMRSGEISLLIPPNLTLKSELYENVKTFNTDYGLYLEIPIKLPDNNKIEIDFSES